MSHDHDTATTSNREGNAAIGPTALVARMKLFGHLQSLVDRSPAEPLPTEVFAVLIDDLYSVLVSLAIGATTATLVGGIAVLRTGNPWLAVLTVATAAIAAARLLLTFGYRKNRPTFGGDAVTLRRWERWYAIGASVYGDASDAPVSSASRSPTTRSAIFCSFQTRSDFRPELRRAIPAGRGSRWRKCPSFVAHRHRQCASPRSCLHRVVTHHVPVLSRDHRNRTIFGRESRYGRC